MPEVRQKRQRYRSCCYAPLSQDNDGKYTWGTPVTLPGAVSLSPDPQGEPESFYADANSVLLENAASETGKFALLFEFDGDVRKTRHVL